MRVVKVVVAVVLAMVGLAPVAVARSGEPVGLPVIIAEAVALAAGEHPGSEVYGAYGTFAAPTSDPGEATEWLIGFGTDGEGGDFAYAYAPDGTFVEARAWERPASGVGPLGQLDLTQWDAVVRLRDAGIDGAFDAVAVRHPAVFEGEPTYYFCLVDGRETVSVGAWTGGVETGVSPC
ncbi:hypothetical protein GCM10022243_55250 [Saccharothrix violaceirubra]|uniref:Uncharacterized protein n=1 Tax=Saccharothrix violaceirubra TaxID=413306 RepID=A0A7W7WXE8_9PSEU|nr:hypothetical protein [Saccharothrix violaceirubra]MBB4967036.1 hypothetical protein [Saccharothrix violaceirubra]